MFELLNKNFWSKSIVIKETNERGYSTLLEVSYYIDPMEGFEFSYRLLYSLDDTLARWVNPNSYVSSESLKAAKKSLLDMYNVEIPNFIRQGMSTIAYQQMLDAAQHYGYPKHYKEDLTYHDALNLGINDCDRFVWILRESGTWLISGQDRFGITCIEYRDKTYHYFTFDNGVLTEVDKQTCLDFYATLPKEKEG